MTSDRARDRVDTRLDSGALDVWSASLAPTDPAPSELASCLCVEERMRAERFASPQDRDRFIVGRAFLRHLLARYLGGRPEDVRLRLGTHGKPAVEGDTVSFNLAHSGALAVCALGPGGQEIGIDVERVQPLKHEAGVARMILAPRERDDLERLPEQQRLRRLFEIWICKEAILKRAGTGLDRPLPGLEIRFPPDESPRVFDLDRDGGTGTGSRLRLFEPASGFIAAVATAPGVDTVHYQAWHWD